MTGDLTSRCAPAGRSYCQRLQQPSFWGGEVEILVLSRMLKVPVYVYKTAEEAGKCAPPRPASTARPRASAGPARAARAPRARRACERAAAGVGPTGALCRSSSTARSGPRRGAAAARGARSACSTPAATTTTSCSRPRRGARGGAAAALLFLSFFIKFVKLSSRSPFDVVVDTVTLLHAHAGASAPLAI